MRRLTVLAMLALTVGVSAARATEWCGENGVIRFSFAEGDSLVEVLHTGDPDGGVTTVEVVAWLADVVPVERDMERFLTVGGFELELTMSGADGFILKQEFPGQAVNVCQKTGSLAVGFVRGQRLQSGRTRLVSWQIMFQGHPENVRFGLNEKGTITCGTTKGCPEANPPAIYIGVESSGQVGNVFGAGYVPAWLNPSGEPACAAVHGGQDFSEVGIFRAVN